MGSERVEMTSQPTMPTRGVVCVVNPDKTITGVWLHHDAYPFGPYTAYLTTAYSTYKNALQYINRIKVDENPTGHTGDVTGAPIFEKNKEVLYRKFVPDIFCEWGYILIENEWYLFPPFGVDLSFDDIPNGKKLSSLIQEDEETMDGVDILPYCFTDEYSVEYTAKGKPMCRYHTKRSDHPFIHVGKNRAKKKV